MRCASSTVVASLLLGVAVSCGDENEPPTEQGRPATFGDACTRGGVDPCRDPFVCLEVPDFSAQGSGASICTMACQQTADCPMWHVSEGPCAGEVQSQCVRQLCRDACR